MNSATCNALAPVSTLAAPARREASADAWFSPGRFAVVLGLVILALYSDVVLGWRTFVFRDYGLFGYPLAYYYRESFWAGEVPLWNPLNNCGLPFAAQWNTMVFYPVSLLYLLFPLAWALSVFCLVHLYAAGLGMYFLARSWTENRFAAAVAGVAFAFNGLTLNCLMWPNNIAALGCLPWVMLAGETAWREGGRWIVVAALLGAMQMLAGAPEIIMFTWLLLAGLWALDFARATRPRLTLGRRLCAVVALISMLSAVQLLPFLDLLVHSQRDDAYSTGASAMPGSGWANFLVPLFRCYKSGAGVFFQPGQYWTSSYYHSLGVLVLAVVAAFLVRSARARLLAIFAVAAAILSLGDDGFLYRLLCRHVPQLSFMNFPIKFVIVVIVVIPLLAALVVREYSEDAANAKGTHRTVVIVLYAGCVVAILWLLWFASRYPDEYERWPNIARNGLARIAFLTLTVGLLLAMGRLPGSRLQVVARLGLLVVLWADVATHVPGQNPTVAPGAFEPNLPDHQRLDLPPDRSRGRAMLSAEAQARFEKTFLADPLNTYLGERCGLYYNCNLLDGIPKVDGLFSLYLREQFLVGYLLFSPTNGYATNLADFMAARQVSAPGDPLDWRARETAMPLVTIGQRPAFFDEKETIAALLATNFNPRRHVLLPPEARGFVTVSNQTEARIVNARCTPHRLDIQTEAKTSSLLVIAQTFYHPWQAYVDGRKAYLWRANHAFQALEVPAGVHRVELVYEDRLFLTGAVLSGAGLAGCAGLGFRRRRVPPV